MTSVDPGTLIRLVISFAAATVGVFIAAYIEERVKGR